MLTPASIAWLREIPIYDVVRPHMQLKRTGDSRFAGCCLFTTKNVQFQR